MNKEIVMFENINLYNIIYSFFKRIFDIFVSLVLIIILILISIIIKIIYIINKDYDSIIYKQERIGMFGNKFYIYKFRTMIKDADLELEKLLKIKKYKLEWDKYQKLRNDPRITKVGKFLRNTCLDELPQVINVLKGEMSFIGPRPLVEGELDRHHGNKDLYYSIKPGITGYYVSFYNDKISYEERLDLEYYYILNRSFKLDIKIILNTIILILKKGGSK